MTKAQIHERVSYVKSVLRIVGYAFLPFSIVKASAVLVVSELLGIAEEVWGA